MKKKKRKEKKHHKNKFTFLPILNIKYYSSTYYLILDKYTFIRLGH